MGKRPLVGSGRMLAAAVLAVLTSSCSSLATRVPDVSISAPRMVVMPAYVEVFELNASGETVFRPDWQAVAARNVETALERLIRANGARMFSEKDVGETKVRYSAFRRWTTVSMEEILDELDGRSHADHHSVGEWRFPFKLATWREALNADFALVVRFWDGFQSPDLALLNMVAPVRHTGKQTGVACVLDLRDGRVVWCDRTARGYGDLRAPADAEKAVGRLLKSLFSP